MAIAFISSRLASSKKDLFAGRTQEKGGCRNECEWKIYKYSSDIAPGRNANRRRLRRWAVNDARKRRRHWRAWRRCCGRINRERGWAPGCRSGYRWWSRIGDRSFDRRPATGPGVSERQTKRTDSQEQCRA